MSIRSSSIRSSNRYQRWRVRLTEHDISFPDHPARHSSRIGAKPLACVRSTYSFFIMRKHNEAAGCRLFTIAQYLLVLLGLPGGSCSG
jgi:hypothetical protein